MERGLFQLAVQTIIIIVIIIIVIIIIIILTFTQSFRFPVKLYS